MSILAQRQGCTGDAKIRAGMDRRFREARAAAIANDTHRLRQASTWARLSSDSTRNISFFR
jgi:hypothetical protein